MLKLGGRGTQGRDRRMKKYKADVVITIKGKLNNIFAASGFDAKKKAKVIDIEDLLANLDVNNKDVSVEVGDCILAASHLDEYPAEADLPIAEERKDYTLEAEEKLVDDKTADKQFKKSAKKAAKEAKKAEKELAKLEKKAAKDAKKAEKAAKKAEKAAKKTVEKTEKPAKVKKSKFKLFGNKKDKKAKKDKKSKPVEYKRFTLGRRHREVAAEEVKPVVEVAPVEEQVKPIEAPVVAPIVEVQVAVADKVEEKVAVEEYSDAAIEAAISPAASAAAEQKVVEAPVIKPAAKKVATVAYDEPEDESQWGFGL